MPKCEGWRAVDNSLGRGRIVVLDHLHEEATHAVHHRLSADGWVPAERTDTVDALRVISDLTFADPRQARRTAVLASPSPAACQSAVAALTHGAVGAAITADDLDALSPALDSLQSDRCVLTHVLLERARRAPRLDERQVLVLGCRLAGLSDRAMAQRLALSPATVRRTSTELCRVFGVTTRGALMARAAGRGRVVAGVVAPRARR
jgi:DNA-binding NarL/FixJ family response regulator